MKRKAKKGKTTKTLRHKVQRYALLSVSDRTGLASFAKGLKKLGFQIISSGGTAKFLRKSGLRPTEAASLTKYPPLLSGRVKTLHPVIHGGILADKTNPAHLKDLKKYKIHPFDIVVCNLYPFEEVISRQRFTHEEAIENIDIGGPCMVRGAAKNHKNVAIIVDPADYKAVLAELKKGGELSLATKQRLALKAFRHTKAYDAVIINYLSAKFDKEDLFPAELEIDLHKIQDLRYGENPHQRAAFYREVTSHKSQATSQITGAKQLHGKELTFNNIVDLDAAWALVNYFADPTVAVIKHNNPCGVAKGKSVLEAYQKAFAADPVSAFGGVVASNRRVDEFAAKEMSSLFMEAVIAPSYTPRALEILKEKPNLRIMEMGEAAVNRAFAGLDFKKVSGGFLAQEPDLAQLGMNEIKVVTRKEPTLQEMEDLFFAWGVVKFVKSNAIVIVKEGVAVGVGAGQMSRVEAVEIAVKRAKEKAKGAVLASEAFFPFADNVELAAKAGIAAIIQPGGSKRDQESIDKANKNGIAMVFTGRRHFKH